MPTDAFDTDSGMARLAGGERDGAEVRRLPVSRRSCRAAHSGDGAQRRVLTGCVPAPGPGLPVTRERAGTAMQPEPAVPAPAGRRLPDVTVLRVLGSLLAWSARAIAVTAIVMALGV